MLTKALAFELAPYGIRVNGINPGPVETKFASDLHDSPAVKDKLLQRLLIQRIGQPADVANVAAFLASDDASYITGTMCGLDDILARYLRGIGEMLCGADFVASRRALPLDDH